MKQPKTPSSIAKAPVSSRVTKSAPKQLTRRSSGRRSSRASNKSTTKQRAAADPYNPENKLVDSLRPDLDLVFIGLNPGLTTAATGEENYRDRSHLLIAIGHAYAHPSNHFWKLLHSSGITPVRHDPSQTHDLPDLYAIGNTNICARATRSGDGLSKEEMVEGAHILEEKILRIAPAAVCIVGKGIWDTIYKVKTGKVLKGSEFSYGWQAEEMWLGRIYNKDGTVKHTGAKTFVATTTSGLAAGISNQKKLDIWTPLGNWVRAKREERRGDK